MSDNQHAKSLALTALAAAVERYRHDAITLGREALRVLRSHRLTWADLFGPLAAAEPVYRAPDNSADLWAVNAGVNAACIMTDLFLMTPAELALAAVLIRCGPRPIENPNRISLMLRANQDRLLVEMAANRHSIGVPGCPFWPFQATM